MSLRAQIVKMQVGEQLTIPVTDYGYTTIRSYASDLGFAYKRKYSTKRNRQERTYTIVRNE
jgi:TusA-related sulfurtransferase